MKKIILVLLFMAMFFPDLSSAQISQTNVLNIETRQNGQIVDMLVNLFRCQTEYDAELEKETQKYFSDIYDEKNNCYWYIDELPKTGYQPLPLNKDLRKECSISINNRCMESRARYTKKYHPTDSYRFVLTSFDREWQWQSGIIDREYINGTIVFDIEDNGRVSYFEIPHKLDDTSFYYFLFRLGLHLILKMTLAYGILNMINKVDLGKDNHIDKEKIWISLEKNRDLSIKIYTSIFIASVLSMTINWYLVPLIVPINLVEIFSLMWAVLFDTVFVYIFNDKKIGWARAFWLGGFGNIAIFILGYLPYTRSFIRISY